MSTQRTPYFLDLAVRAQLAFEDACRAAGRDPVTDLAGPGPDGTGQAAHAAFVTYTRSAGVGADIRRNDEIRAQCRAAVADGVVDLLVKRALPRAVGASRLMVRRYENIDPRRYVQVIGGATVGMSRRELAMAAIQDDPELARVYACALRDSLALP